METADVDIDRYMGNWFEIARFPNRFEEGCAGVTATYIRLARQRIEVTNTCRDGGLDGDERSAEGRARIVGPGQLAVSFLPEGLSFLDGVASGDYWVLWVDESYQAAVVGAPNGKTGWIMARNPVLEQATTDAALEILKAAGYRTEALHWTEQSDGGE